MVCYLTWPIPFQNRNPNRIGIRVNSLNQNSLSSQSILNPKLTEDGKRSPKGKSKVELAKKTNAGKRKTGAKVKLANSFVDVKVKLLSDAMQESNGGKSMVDDGTTQNEGENMGTVKMPDKFMYFPFKFNSNNKCRQHFNFNNIHRGKKIIKKRDVSALTESKSRGAMVLQRGWKLGGSNVLFWK